MTSLIWFRQDLRLTDQPALAAAVADGAAIPVYILDDQSPSDRATVDRLRRRLRCGKG